MINSVQVTEMPRPNNGVASQVITIFVVQPPQAVVGLSRASTTHISKLANEFACSQLFPAHLPWMIDGAPSEELQLTAAADECDRVGPWRLCVSVSTNSPSAIKHRCRERWVSLLLGTIV